MKKVVFLGAKKIGLECLKILHDKSEELSFEIVGVATNARGKEITEYAKENHIELIDGLDGYLNIPEVDITISVQYHEILKKQHISKASEITVNLHMAPLPEYRGCNQFSFAILEGKELFGTTLHRLEEGIDSGDIIFESRFPISKNIWVEELYDITFKKSVELFEQSLAKLIAGNYQMTPQIEFVSERGTSIHYRKEIADIKQIDLDWPSEKINRHIRATHFSGFEPPYTIVDAHKVYLTKEI
ncbi:MAG: hypothetical protein ED555_03985 [Allomuricauda sp.]|nr:MAG: hypothetical protein ED555_03985 [Allomuricauda sp.]